MGGKDSPKPLSRLKRFFKRNISSPPSSGQRICDVHSSRPPTSSTAAGEAETEPTEQQHKSLSKSQDLWNAAFDSLAQSENTAKLVRSYIKTLTTVLEIKLSDVEVSASLNDRSKRQDLMRELVEGGQAKLSKTSTVTNGASAVAQFIVSVKGLVDAAIQNIPQAALPWIGVSIGLQILINPANATRSNLDGIAHVVSRMRWYCALTEYLLENDDVDGSKVIWPQLEEKIVSLYRALLLYQMKSVCFYYRHRGYEFLRDLANWNHWDDDIKTVRAAEDDLRNDIDQYIQIQGKDILGQLFQNATKTNELLESFHQTLQDFVIFQKSNVDEKNKQCLRDLFVVDPQDDMKKIEKNKDSLLSEVNEWIFQMEEYQAFTDWSSISTTLPSCRLLWIKGSAGTGKTMLLMGIVRDLLSHSATFAPRVSHFFCQGTIKTLNTATATLRCLIWMILVQQPHLISHLKSKHDNAGASLFEDDSAFISLKDVFENILKDPKLSPVYLVVDALDECEQGLGDLKKLIFASLKISNGVKWLISSRPTVDLKCPETEGSLVELDSQKLHNPVNAFIDHKLSILKVRQGYTHGILEHLKEEISQRAENTFLWVALVFKELDKEDGYQIVVDGMYALDIVRETPSGLSQLYDYMMDKIERGVRKDCEYCKNVLVAATLAFRPLTLSELRVLAQLPDSIPATIVRKCGSFLTVQNETVYLIHQSAKEYLQGNYESKLQPAGMSQGHEDIARYSIQAMSSDLRQNMYSLDYGFKPDIMRPPQPNPLDSIRYSCVFWADHLDAANLESLEHNGALADDGEALVFLREKFLNWLEGLSLLDNLPEGVDSIKKLLQIAQKSNAESQLARFLTDAEKLIQSHGSIIERAPLQAYASALAFTPTTSEVRAAQWKHRLPFIKLLAGVKTHWGAHRQTLDGHSEVTSLAFSPDGRMLAAGLYDKTIRLWEVSTGSRKQTLEGHTREILSTEFSPDGRILASASYDKTIRLWEVSTGSYKRTLEGHKGPVNSIAFSPDGKILASSSSDTTIRLWDTALGSCQQTIEGPDAWVTSVAFSPASKILASASDRGPIRFWDIAAEKQHQMLKIPGVYTHALYIAFSPDGSILAAVSQDCTIELWDTGSWSHRQTIKTYVSRVYSLAFSPDGNMLAFEGAGGAVQLWNITTGSPWNRFGGHSREIGGIAFSPDGLTLASASHDKTIRLWEVGSENSQRTVEGHSDWHHQRVTFMAFSPYGETLVLASHNGFQVWDIATWSCQQTIPQDFISDLYYKPVMVFSPDGRTLAVTLRDEVQLWDTATWTCRLMQKGARPFSPSTAPAVVFSPDSKMLATASQDETLRLWLWDVTTGSTLWELGGNQDVEFVAFSPDGKTLALASRGGITLWDTATRSQQQILNLDRETNYFLRLAFSPDGKSLASASWGAIQLWENRQWIFEKDQGCGKFLTFPPVAKTLAYASYHEATDLWDTAAWKHWRVKVSNSRFHIFSLAFSSDGAYLLANHQPIRLPTISTSFEQRSDEDSSETFLHFDDEWVCLNGKQILWLPADYRPYSRPKSTVHGNKMAWANQAGRPIFLQVTCAEIMP